MVTPTPKRMLWRVTRLMPCLKDGAKASFVMFLRGAQLVPWSSFFLVFCLDEVDVTLENAEIFGFGAVWRRWICWWWLAVLLKYSWCPSVDPCHS